MMERPAALARWGKVSSQTVKQNSESLGTLERYGSIFAPAGMMWSVVMLSPTFRVSGALISSFSGSPSGMGRMLGPRTTSTFLASSGLAGMSTPLSSA